MIYKTLIFIILLFSIQSPVLAQGEKEKDGNHLYDKKDRNYLYDKIMSLKRELRLKKHDISNSDKEKEEVEIKLTNAQSSNNNEDIKYYRRRLINITQERNDLKNEFKKLKESLKSFLDENCTEIELAEIKELCENTRKEIENNKFIIDGKNSEILDNKAALNDVMHLNSWISNFEIGVKTRNGIKVIKKYQGEEIIYGKPFLKSLNVVISSGKMYAYSGTSVPTEGKLLIYADNILITEVNISLEKKPLTGGVIEYSFDLNGVELSEDIPQNSIINIGYVDTKSYIENKSPYKNFWDAQATGKFLISNIEPQYSQADEIDDILSNCKNKKSLKTSSEFINLSIRDDGWPDRDVIAVYYNDKQVIKEVLTESFSKKKKLYLRSGINEIKFVVVDIGRPNSICTASFFIEFDDGREERIPLKGDYNKTECITIVKE